MDALSLSTQGTPFPWNGFPLEIKQHIIYTLLDDRSQDEDFSGYTLLKAIRNLASVSHCFDYDVLRQALIRTVMALQAKRQEVDPCVAQAPGLPLFLELCLDVTIDDAKRTIWSIENREEAADQEICKRFRLAYFSKSA